MDTMTKEQRSERMGRVRNKNTKPELLVRRLVLSLGLRYRLQGYQVAGKRLAGNPDVIFPGRKKVIFTHGCFWHRHGEGCPLTRWPKSRLEFWVPKLEANSVRDCANQAALREQGWDFLVVWECELKDTNALRARIKAFLGVKP